MIGKLRHKFILINMLLISIVLLCTFLAVYQSTRQRLAQESTDLLHRTIEEGFREKPLREESNPGIRRPDFKPMPTFTVTTDTEGNITSANGVLFDLSDQEALGEIVARCIESDQDTGIVAGENLRYLKQGIPEGVKIAFVDREFETTTLNSLVKTSMLVGAGSMTAFFFISLFLARLALRPVEKAWEQQKQFVADASHELRTPLTVILANTGILLSNREQTVNQQAKWVENIQSEAARMSTLVDNMLYLARTDDAGQEMAALESVNLSDVVWGSILPFEPLIFEQKKSLASDIEPGLYISGNEGSLKQLVGILLDNACKYADEQGSISVRLYENEEHKVLLEVNNSGAPIPEDQVEQIFERFFRVDKSRSRQQGGYGLGLAIAESITKMHHARISVKSTEQEGTTFTVSFGALPKAL